MTRSNRIGLTAARRISCPTGDSSSSPRPKWVFFFFFSALSRARCHSFVTRVFDFVGRRRMIPLGFQLLLSNMLCFPTNSSCIVCVYEQQFFSATVLNLQPAPLFSGIQFCLPSTCSTERTPQQTPGKPLVNSGPRPHFDAA